MNKSHVRMYSVPSNLMSCTSIEDRFLPKHRGINSLFIGQGNTVSKKIIHYNNKHGSN